MDSAGELPILSSILSILSILSSILPIIYTISIYLYHMPITSEKILGNTITVSINSSNLKNAIYNTESKILTITFNNNFQYQYYDVDWTLFTKFRMSDSQGKFFNQYIAKHHNYKKLD